MSVSNYNRASFLRNAHQERLIMTTIAKNVAKAPPYSFMDMLRLCQSTAPSTVLRTGGFLMEIYIIRYGKRGASNFLETRTTQVRPSQMEQLVRRYGFPFWFHLISKLKTFHRGLIFLTYSYELGAAKALFYWTMMMEYRGLSRFGRLLQAV